ERGKEGVDVFINDFWSSSVYDKHIHRKAKIVTAIGMFYDLDDPNQFIADIAEVLAPDGLFIAQLMCLKNMIEIGDVGNLAHEHLEFYSVQSLKHLFYKHGLELFDIRKNKVNGGSYRLYVRHIFSNSKVRTDDDASLRVHIASSAEDHLQDPAFYHKFFDAMEQNKVRTRNFISQEIRKGKKVWVYGASTKGNVILQYYGLDKSLIQGAAERS